MEVKVAYDIENKGNDTVIIKNGNLEEKPCCCVCCVVKCCCCFLGKRDFRVTMLKTFSNLEVPANISKISNESDEMLFAGYTAEIDTTTLPSPPPYYDFTGDDEKSKKAFSEVELKMIDKHNLISMFQTWDVDQTGFIDFDEFFAGMIKSGYNLDKQECLVKFENFDVSGDHLLSFPEFVTFACTILK